MLQLVFVMARGQNHFFVELVDALRTELTALGVTSSVAHGAFPPPEPETAYVLVPPHEWFRLEQRRGDVDTTLFARTVCLCTEQPGTSHFVDNIELGADAAAVFDINRGGVREFRRHGVKADHFQLGYTPAWDASEEAPERDVDAVFMGCATDRRLEHLGSYADLLWRWRCRLLISDNSRPNTDRSAGFLTGREKRSLLARSRVLLNLHQRDERYFEWFRIIEAISNGCLPVTEHSADFDPLVAGTHMIVGRAGNLGYLANGVLQDETRRAEMAASARSFLRDELPLRAAVERLAEAAADAADRPLPGTRVRSAIGGGGHEDESVSSEFEDETEESVSVLRAAVKSMRLDLLDLNRTLARDRLERQLGSLPPGISIDSWTPAWAQAAPRVSVLTTLFNYGRYIRPALESIGASSYRSLELVVVDDASTDDSLAQARDWMTANPSMPALLLTRALNRGLPHGRNAALGFARGEYAFILDADNEVYPGGIARLVDALDNDPGAVFAYGILELFDAGGSVGLANYHAWDPHQLRTSNFIDAMALIRTEALRAFGGYTTDARLHGWEDYALWCSIADAGERGVLAPEIVARYRTSQTSMLALTNVSSTVASAVLMERNPNLMAGARLPL